MSNNAFETLALTLLVVGWLGVYSLAIIWVFLHSIWLGFAALFSLFLGMGWVMLMSDR